jgi:branched-subunit amino acid ABC-type transport system permease component
MLTAFFENLELAQVQGVDTIRVGSAIWLVSGGLAGLAGSMLPIHFQIAPNYGYGVMFFIIAASLMGGMGDLAGVFLGATVMGVIEIGVVHLVQSLGAVWFGEYRYLLPIAVISLMMYFKPNGSKGRNA